MTGNRGLCEIPTNHQHRRKKCTYNCNVAELDIKLQIVGLLDLNSNINIQVLGDQESSKFSNFIFVDDQLQAVESINSPGHHLIMKNNWGKRYSLTKDKFESDLNLKNFFNSLP